MGPWWVWSEDSSSEPAIGVGRHARSAHRTPSSGWKPKLRLSTEAGQLHSIAPWPTNWPPLAAALSRAHAAGYDVAARLPELAATAPLPDRHPARELHWRLLDDCPDALPALRPIHEAPTPDGPTGNGAHAWPSRPSTDPPPPPFDGPHRRSLDPYPPCP